MKWKQCFRVINIILHLTITLGLIGMPSAGLGQELSNTDTPKWFEYRSPDGLYGLAVPSNWIIQTGPSGKNISTTDIINFDPINLSAHTPWIKEMIKLELTIAKTDVSRTLEEQVMAMIHPSAPYEVDGSYKDDLMVEEGIEDGKIFFKSHVQ